MSTKHIRTAADLVRFKASVRVVCGECGLSKTMSGQMVVKAGGVGSLAQVCTRFRCSRCVGVTEIMEHTSHFTTCSSVSIISRSN